MSGPKRRGGRGPGATRPADHETALEAALPFSLTDPPLSAEVLAAMEDVRQARHEVSPAFDQLLEAGRATVDVKRQIRRHPGRAAAIAGGAGFLALGGPGRVVGAIARRLPGKRDPYDGLLPGEVRRVLKKSGAPREEELERALEADFARYLKDKGRVESARPRLATSLWRTYDSLIGPVGAVAAGYAERTSRQQAAARPSSGGKPAAPRPASGPGPRRPGTRGRSAPGQGSGGPGQDEGSTAG